MRERKPQVIIKFNPDPNFEEQMKEFVEEVLGWEEQDGKLYQNTQRNTGDTCQNEAK